MTQTVLLTGATGMFGSRIARHLVNERGVRVRLLVRRAEEAAKRDALSPLLEGGAEIIHGDLADRLALDRATQGVDVVVSAVQGIMMLHFASPRRIAADTLRGGSHTPRDLQMRAAVFGIGSVLARRSGLRDETTANATTWNCRS